MQSLTPRPVADFLAATGATPRRAAASAILRAALLSEAELRDGDARREIMLAAVLRASGR